MARLCAGKNRESERTDSGKQVRAEYICKYKVT